MPNVDVNVRVNNQTAAGVNDVEKSVDKAKRKIEQTNQSTATLAKTFTTVRNVALAASAAVAGLVAAGDRVLAQYRSNLIRRGEQNADLIAGDAKLRELKNEFARFADEVGPAIAKFRTAALEYLKDGATATNVLAEFLSKPRENLAGQSFGELGGNAIELAFGGTAAALRQRDRARRRNQGIESPEEQAVKAELAEERRLQLLELQIRQEKALAEVETDPERRLARQQTAETLELAVKQGRELLNIRRGEFSPEFIAGVKESQQLESNALLTRQQAAQVQIEINRELEAGNKLREELADRISTLAELESTGAISSLSAVEQQRKAVAEYRVEIEKVIERLQLIRDFGANPEQIKQINDGIDKFEQRTKELPRNIATIGDAVQNDLVGPFQQLFADAALNLNNLKGVISSFASAIGDVFVQLAARLAALSIIGTIFSPFTPGGSQGGSRLGKLLQAALPGLAAFNSGGLVPGSGPDRDTVPAILTSGEFVMSRKAVQRIGAQALARLNATAGINELPIASIGGPMRFNAGGLVPSVSSDRPGVSFVAPSERALERTLAGGDASMIEWLQNNAARARQALRIS